MSCEPLSSSVGNQPSTPFLSVKAKEEKAFYTLVEQYIAAKDVKEAEGFNGRLVREYSIDLESKTYKNKAIPVSQKKAIDIVAQIGYELFQIDRRKNESTKGLGIGIPTLQLSRTINLFSRLVEVKRVLLRTPQSTAMQKTYISHAHNVTESARTLFALIEGKVDNPSTMNAFFDEMRQKLLSVEKAVKKKSLSEADFYLVDMSDKAQQIRGTVDGILKRLFEQEAYGSSYQADLGAVKRHLDSAQDIFTRFDQEIVERTPWGQLRMRADTLRKDLGQAPSSETSISMNQSLAAVDLHLEASSLLHELMDFVSKNIENAFDDASI